MKSQNKYLPKKISICYVNPGINIRRPIALISNKLCLENYAISIFTPHEKRYNERKKTRHYDNYSNINLISYPVLTNNSGYLWPIPTDIKFFKKIWNVFKLNDIIHIWAPFYPNTILVCLIKLLFFKKKRLIITMDTFPGYSFKLSNKLDPLFKIFYKTLGRLINYSANNITIYGKSFLKYAKKAKLPLKKIVITPTGINFNTSASDINIRKELNFDENDKIILYIGLLNKRKGIDIILRIAKLLKIDNVKFIIVGTGSEEAKLHSLAKDFLIDNKVFFIGKRFDVYNFYNQSDIFLFPSHGEGLAGVLMEALLYEIPIIASDIPGNRELINNMHNGLLCRKEDDICYVKSIKKLLENDVLIKKITKNGLEILSEKFMWEKNIKKFKLLYQKVLNC